MYDIIIRGGSIVDGKGAEPVVGDVGVKDGVIAALGRVEGCLLYTSPSPRDATLSRMPSSA